MAQAYRHLSGWYEYLNDDCGYPEWSQYFISGLRKYGAGENGLELGCGSGVFCRLLCRAGFRMSGTDRSPEMLTAAEKAAREEGMRIMFFRADAAKLRAPEKYDFILAPNDVFNYLPPERHPAAFKHVCGALKRDGIFWLDVSSPRKLCRKVADTVCADDRDEVTYLSFNRRTENRIEMDVTLFVKQANGMFERLDEQHVQYIHEEKDITAALEEAGFELLSVEGHLGEPKEESDRLNFICRKK